ncbi:MAG: hypothetical protein ACRD00_01240 [Thermoanaerobaculia bacterium]
MVPAGLRAQEATEPEPAARPLPDVREFFGHVRENLRSDGALLAEYTFTEKHTEMRLNSHGGVKKTKTAVYEVYPSDTPGKMYRRLVARDGKLLAPTELAAQDKQQEERAEKRRIRREKETPEEREKRLARQEEQKRREREIVDEVFNMDDLVMERRETIDGRSTIQIAFQPRPGYKAENDGARVVQKLAGRAWVDEEDYQLVKIEATLLDSLGVGPGGLIRLQKGAKAFLSRRRVNNEIWLPARARFTGAAKALFFVVGRVDAQSDYGDYKKFSVSTSETVSAEKSSN